MSEATSVGSGTLRVGFVGLGSMGVGMAGRLLASGFPTSVHNRTTAKAEPLRELGATVAATPAEAARDVDVLFVSLANAEVVENALFGPDGAQHTLRRGAVVADTSTVSPLFATRLAERLAIRQCAALDTCVLGNAQHAKDGELRFMIGGDADAVDRIRPALDVLSKDVVHLGEHGMGASAKIAMNLLMGAQMQALSEAIVLGEKAGVPRAAMIKMIAASGYSSPVMRFKSGVMGRRAFANADFRLDLMRKDMLLALTEASRLGVELPVTAATNEMLRRAESDGLGAFDCAAVLAELERMSGITGYPWPSSASGGAPNGAPGAAGSDNGARPGKPAAATATTGSGPR
ncbi:MAG TPA: NAD(P)-dependent oxidoreductase [Pseudonocardiaceae bacterium]|jgi:3-hydroxyisobutyrate dehydrogenase|nr:NAD(P)-dependent oxidoreductase [Pseudonocardiaceae bacterium]